MRSRRGRGLERRTNASHLLPRAQDLILYGVAFFKHSLAWDWAIEEEKNVVALVSIDGIGCFDRQSHSLAEEED